LVKESLASSYEQMQLPGEALLQYDEFRLYMPDLSDKEESMVRRARRKSKALMEDSEDTPSDSLTSLADAGDFLGFRKKIRTEYDLTAVLDIMRRYLFARELSLLFRMEQPVAVLSRCQNFIKVMHSILMRGISELDQEDRHERKSKASAWVVQFSWDIFCATRQYLNCSSPAKESTQKRFPQTDVAVGAKLSEILEISRLFLIKLSDDHAETLNLFSLRRKKFPKDLQRSWPEWTPCESKADDDKTSPTEDLVNASIAEDGKTERQFLFCYKDTLDSLEKFEEAYLKICGAIIEASHSAKHFRLSARIQAEVGEYHASKGDYRKAAANFQKIVKVYRVDHWDRCHFWRVFRLAYCQRTTASPPAYLKTLCSCFSPRSATVAPKVAQMALFNDLQRVIEHPSIGNARYSRLLFIETSLSISTALDQFQMGRILDQKQVEKRFCSVGESFKIPISIRSHLPGTIELTSVKLFAVNYSSFTSILAQGDAVQEEDAAKVLSIDPPIKLNPGNNEYIFEWKPSSPGHYVLSTVEIVWKQGYFYYDSMDLQDPLRSIEVLPSEPTHSISLEPSSLVPGQHQEVQITFEAGSDVIDSGKLMLSGTNGILIIPPGEDAGSAEWRQDCETNLKPCKPGETQVVTAHVKCDPVEISSNESVSEVDSINAGSGLVAKVLTTYMYAQTEGEKEPNPPSMKASLEAFAPILDKMALSVESIETHWFGEEDSFLLNITLTSNTPYRFTVDGWDIKLASPIKISTSSDLNEYLLKRTVSDNDQLSFAFECSVDQERQVEARSLGENKMHLNLYDDAGKKFSNDLPLDLTELYSKISVLDNSKSTGTLLADLVLETNRGMVGEPLEITFVLDTRNIDVKKLSKDNNGIGFVYSVVSGRSQWLLGGKVNGIIDFSKTQTLSCVGIPVVPGMLDHFPTITLGLLKSSGSSLPINVECQQPEVFQSMPITEVNSIATPIFKEGS